MSEPSADEPPLLSIVVPVKDDAHALAHLLTLLANHPASALARLEIVVVDGQSSDGSAALAEKMGARVLVAPAGRGGQLNIGCRAARGSLIWMLHADSRPSTAALDWLLAAPPEQLWGRFDITFDQDHLAFKLIAAMMNGRSRLTGICTGDQGIFVNPSLLKAIGGVPEQALMEDIELSRRLKACCRPECPGLVVCTSTRRWRKHGIWRTVWSMWWFRLRYWLGEDPTVLAGDYYAG